MNKSIKLSGQPIICQLFSFIPDALIAKAVEAHNSDHYYKTMRTRNQLVFMLYGILTKAHSLNALCKNLQFLENKLSYLGIKQLPASSTLSDANINRNSDVFAFLYQLLYQHYQSVLSDSYLQLFVNGEVDPGNVRIFDATTISLFVEVFKGSGRNPINGKRKGGLKVQAQLPLSGFVPDFMVLTDASANDRNFLGQLPAPEGTIYVFDKGYMNYQVFDDWTKNSVFYVTRLQENASYQVLECTTSHLLDYVQGGVVSDSLIELRCKNGEPLKARLIVYKDPFTGRIIKFLSNMFAYQAMTVVLLYKNRWGIEVLFKQLKQNFELSYFFSDNKEGIKSQVWIAMIANLLFTVIHKQVKECEQFTTLVGMAAGNLGSYVCFLTILKKTRGKEQITPKIQLDLFDNRKGGVFHKTGKSP